MFSNDPNRREFRASPATTFDKFKGVLYGLCACVLWRSFPKFLGGFLHGVTFTIFLLAFVSFLPEGVENFSEFPNFPSYNDIFPEVNAVPEEVNEN